ncbi:MAG: hypothetical protein JRM82_03490, partial [Nitrososphaerota archaeon]|nr:hypothetical protein [Nitrososphaerota archaeon]
EPIYVAFVEASASRARKIGRRHRT